MRQKWLTIILLAGLAARVAWGWRQGDDLSALPDQTEYLAIGQNLLAGRGMCFTDQRFGQLVYAYRTPGYPLLVAACGARPRVIRLVQAGLDASTILAAYLLARLWLRRGPATVAALLLAVNPYMIFFSATILSDTLYAAMLAWGMLLLVSSGGPWPTTWGKMQQWLIGVVLLVLSVLVRPGGLLMPLVLGVGATLLNYRQGRANTARWPAPIATLMLLLTLLALFPWALRNRQCLRNWVWTSTNAGITRYDGFNANASGASDQSFVNRMPWLASMSETGRSEYLAELADEFIRQHPLRSLELAGIKMARTWSPAPLSEEFGGRRLYFWSGLAYGSIFEALVLAGLLLKTSLPPAAKRFLLLPAIYLTVAAALSVGSLRYRLAAEAPLAIVAAALAGGWAVAPAAGLSGTNELCMMFALPGRHERIFDHAWRGWLPLRPRLSRWRRWGTLALLIFLGLVIVGYNWLTSSRRVAAIARAYLTEKTGGQVHIGHANLSIFEGLRLDDVVFRVDDSGRADSVLLAAQSLIIRYDPGELLRGRLKATQIVVVAPKVSLVQDMATGRWNWQRLQLGKSPEMVASAGGALPTSAPEIILRDAQVRYLQLKRGKPQLQGSITLEGHVSPAPEGGCCRVELQSGWGGGLGPSLRGQVWLAKGCLLSLKDFEFGTDVNSLLPPSLRRFCEDHRLAGRVDIPRFSYVAGHDGTKGQFRAEMTVQGAALSVPSSQWMSGDQVRRVEFFHRLLLSLRDAGWIRPATAEYFRRLSSPAPVRLRDIGGSLVFTDSGIELKGARGRVGNDWLELAGSIGGYSADAPLSLTVNSPAGQALYLPPWSVAYAGSLPPDIQDTYAQFRPEGWYGLRLKVDREQSGGKLNVTGEVDIQNGKLRFDDFPYPLRQVQGKLVLGYDPAMKMEGIRVQDVRGQGPAGGPNADSHVSVDGFVGPLTQTAGAWLTVRGQNLSSERELRDAMPRTVDRVLCQFDPSGWGEFPKFHGDFVCRIDRPVGPHRRWNVQTDIDLDNVQGRLSMFPYPLEGVSSRLEVRDGYLDIINARMNRGQGQININGRVTWKTSISPPTTKPYGPDLTITARNLAVDRDLIQAMPAEQGRWLAEAGAAGNLDIDGRLFAVNPTAQNKREISYALDVAVHDGGLWPSAAGYAISSLEGKLRVGPEKMEILQLTGRHGLGAVQATGQVAWGEITRGLRLRATGRDLPLDASLYQMLPASWRQGWDAVKPEGTVDATLVYGPRGEEGGSSTQPIDSHPPGATGPSAAPAADEGFELTIQPRQLAIMPQALPYRLTDVAGAVTITSGRVQLEDVHGRHGQAAIAFSGQGKLGAAPSWQLKLSGRDLNVDDDLIHALPQSVADLLKSLKAAGRFGVDFSRLSWRPNTLGAKETADVDFAAKITFAGASMDTGIPLRQVVGTMDLAGLVRQGTLTRLAGAAAIDKMTLDGRDARDFKLTLEKDPDQPLLRFEKVEGSLAGGSIGADGQYSYSDTQAGKYDLRLVLRDADVQQLTGEGSAGGPKLPGGRKIQGRVTASLTMAGTWQDASSRRGSGDVVLAGQEMYNMPVVLGLLQIMNLTLPNDRPFTQATSHYTIDGQTVTLQSIDIKGKDMKMSGSGKLNFADKSVDLQLATDNLNMEAWPWIGPLIEAGQKELLQIHVKGTIQQPKVSTSTFDTITTTVDKVFAEKN